MTELLAEIMAEPVTEMTLTLPAPLGERQRLDYYRDLTRCWQQRPAEQLFSHPAELATEPFSWNELEAQTKLSASEMRESVGAYFPEGWGDFSSVKGINPLGAYWCCQYAYCKEQGMKPAQWRKQFKAAYEQIAPPHVSPPKGGHLSIAPAPGSAPIHHQAHQMGHQARKSLHELFSQPPEALRQGVRSLASAHGLVLVEEYHQVLQDTLKQGISPE